MNSDKLAEKESAIGKISYWPNILNLLLHSVASWIVVPVFFLDYILEMGDRDFATGFYNPYWRQKHLLKRSEVNCREDERWLGCPYYKSQIFFPSNLQLLTQTWTEGTLRTAKYYKKTKADLYMINSLRSIVALLKICIRQNQERSYSKVDTFRY